MKNKQLLILGMFLSMLIACRDELPKKLNTNILDSENPEGPAIKVLSTELFYEKSTNNEISSIHIIQTIKANERFFENGNPGKPKENTKIEVWINDVKSFYVVRNGNQVVHYGRSQIQGTTVNMKIKLVSSSSQNVLQTTESFVYIP